MTALANAAALDIGAVDPAEGLTATQIANALIVGNQMLGSWSIDQRFILQVLRTANVPMNGGQQQYTIGIGGNINITRPAAIIAAAADVTGAAATAYAATGDPQYAPAAGGSTMISPLKVFTAEEWESLPMRDILKVFPRGIFYDRQNVGGLGNVFIDGNKGGTMEFVTWSPLAQFVDATTPLTVPDPAYLELMEYGLAVRMVVQFPGLVLPENVARLYSDAENRVKALNAQLVGVGAEQTAAAPAATEQAAA